MKRVLLVLGALALAVAGLPVASAIAATPVAAFQSQEGSYQTPSGRTIHFFVDADRQGSARPRIHISVSARSNGMVEFHTWSFRLTRNSFGYQKPTGHLSTGTQMGRYGQITLTMTRRNSSTQTCTSTAGGTTRVTSVDLDLRASIKFRTLIAGKVSSWGTIRKGPSYTFPSDADHFATYEYGTNGLCGDVIPSGYKPDCVDGWSWSGLARPSSNRPIDFEEIQRPHARPSLHARRVVGLAAPAHATRQDDAFLIMPAPTFDSSSDPNTLTVTTSADGTAKGGGAWAASSSGNTQAEGPCLPADGRSGGQQSSETWSATWQNADPLFRIVLQISSSLTLPDGAVGTFTHHTYTEPAN